MALGWFASLLLGAGAGIGSTYAGLLLRSAVRPIVSTGNPMTARGAGEALLVVWALTAVASGGAAVTCSVAELSLMQTLKVMGVVNLGAAAAGACVS